MNLIVGATGLVGGEICRRLSANNKPVRALARPTGDASRIDELRASGAEVVMGDLKDPASIEAACAGADAVLSTASSMLSRQSGDTIDGVDRIGQLQLGGSRESRRRETFRVCFVFAHRGRFRLAARQARSGAGLDRERDDLHDSTPHFLHGNLVQSGVGLRCSRAAGPASTAKGRIPLVGSHSPMSPNLPCDRSIRRARATPPSRSAGRRPSRPAAVHIFEQLAGAPFTVEYVMEAVLRTGKESAQRALDEAFAALSVGYAHGYAIDMRPLWKPCRCGWSACASMPSGC